MRLTRMLATGCVAVALLAAGTNTGRATGFTCTTPNDLQTAINGAGNSLNVAGTCTGGPVSINQDGFTLNAPSGATIQEEINVFATNVTLSGLTIDGTGASPGDIGVIVQPGASLTISGTLGQGSTIENWTNAEVELQLNASVGISGVTIENSQTGNMQTGVIVQKGGSASIGFVPDFGPTASLPVTISGGGDGIDVSEGGTVTIDNGSITGNGGRGIKASDGASVILGSNLDTSGGSPTAITDNAGGGIKLSNATLKIDGAAITGNTGGPAISASLSTVNINDATVSVSGTLGQPAITVFRSSFLLQSSQVTGPGNSNTLVAAGGSALLLQGDMITASDATAKDATLIAVDGSTIESLGGNTIRNTATNGTVIAVENASTFHELIGSFVPFAPSTDTIQGLASVQMQSNMELGTGAATSSTWSGNISVLQNSSFRMDGGMGITGGVQLGQGSNGFFNKAAGGTNTVSLGVTCVGTASSHVAGPTNVSPAVVPVTTGSGCYAF